MSIVLLLWWICIEGCVGSWIQATSQSWPFSEFLFQFENLISLCIFTSWSFFPSFFCLVISTCVCCQLPGLPVQVSHCVCEIVSLWLLLFCFVSVNRIKSVEMSTTPPPPLLFYNDCSILVFVRRRLLFIPQLGNVQFCFVAYLIFVAFSV